jgi:HlyD family secretion protein
VKTEIRYLNELTDSRELLEAKVHPFISYFLLLLFVVLSAALIWSYYGEMDITVKTFGEVRPNEQVSTIRTKSPGKAESVQFKSGERVKKGQILFILGHADLQLQKETIQKQIKEAQSLASQLDYFKTSVLNNEDRFPAELKITATYEQFVKYRTDAENLRSQLEQTEAQSLKIKKEEDIGVQNAELQINQLSDAVHQMNLLKNSISTGQNLLADGDFEYAGKLSEYNLKVQQLQVNINQKKAKYETSAALGELYVPKKQIEDEKNQLASAELELQSYKNDFLLNLQNSISDNNRKLEGLRLQQNQGSFSSGLAAANEKVSKTTLDKFKQDKIVDIIDALKANDDKLKSYGDQLKATDLSIQDQIITAPMDGIINTNNNLSQGDLINAGTDILSIIPENDSVFTIKLMVQNKDIADLKIGDPIKYHFTALPFKEYGELFGKITKISSDATVNGQTGQSFYVVDATIENKPLYNRKGEEARIKVGMVCEAYAITGSKKILYYLLEKLNFKD